MYLGVRQEKQQKNGNKELFCLLYHSQVSNRVPLAYRSIAYPFRQCAIVLVMYNRLCHNCTGFARWLVSGSIVWVRS